LSRSFPVVFFPMSSTVIPSTSSPSTRKSIRKACGPVDCPSPPKQACVDSLHIRSVHMACYFVSTQKNEGRRDGQAGS
jgi:hypothetical protein